MAEHARYTLLTNISHVVHRDLWLYVSAIVIIRDHSGQESDPRRQQVRMFGPSPSWPICDVDVSVEPYRLTEHPLPAGLPKDTVLACRTYDLSFMKQVFTIATNMIEGQPIAVHEFPAGTSISEVWGALVPAVIRSWDSPNFPALVWNPVEVVSAVTARRL